VKINRAYRYELDPNREKQVLLAKRREVTHVDIGGCRLRPVPVDEAGTFLVRYLTMKGERCSDGNYPGNPGKTSG
jgi:hypothetical protein